MKSKPRLLIVDGDAFVYTIGNRVMRPVHLDDGNVYSVFSKADIAGDIDQVFGDLFEELKTRDCLVMLSDPAPKNCWRRAIFPEYKMNRKPGTRPMAYQSVRDYLCDKFNCIYDDNMEADDLCGVYATGDLTHEPVVVSSDKDLLTVPGFIYNPTKKTLDFLTEDQADLNHMTQTLVGDKVDNFPGLPGTGPKTAAKILNGATTLKEAWPLVVAAYEADGLTSKDALIQARLAGILRAKNYNIKTRAIRYWEPPK